MCWDEYRNHRKARADERFWASHGYRPVFRNRVVMSSRQQASWQAQRERLVAALPPLPPDPHETSTTFSTASPPSKLGYLVLAYFCITFGSLFLLSPVLLPIFLFLDRLAGVVGLLHHIRRLLHYLISSPVLSTVTTTLRFYQKFCCAAVGLGLKCIRTALGVAGCIAGTISLLIAVLLLPFRASLKLVRRTIEIAFATLLSGFCLVKRKRET